MINSINKACALKPSVMMTVYRQFYLPTFTYKAWVNQCYGFQTLPKRCCMLRSSTQAENIKKLASWQIDHRKIWTQVSWSQTFCFKYSATHPYIFICIYSHTEKEGATQNFWKFKSGCSMQYFANLTSSTSSHVFFYEDKGNHIWGKVII